MAIRLVRRSGGCVLGEVAGDVVSGRQVGQWWFLDAADVLGFPASGVESAGRRWVQGAGYVAGEQDSPVTSGRVGYRHCGEHGHGVGVQGLGVHGVAVTEFDDLAEVHDADAVGDVPHYERSWAMRT